MHWRCPCIAAGKTSGLLRESASPARVAARRLFGAERHVNLRVADTCRSAKRIIPKYGSAIRLDNGREVERAFSRSSPARLPTDQRNAEATGAPISAKYVRALLGGWAFAAENGSRKFLSLIGRPYSPAVDYIARHVRQEANSFEARSGRSPAPDRAEDRQHVGPNLPRDLRR